MSFVEAGDGDEDDSTAVLVFVVSISRNIRWEYVISHSTPVCNSILHTNPNMKHTTAKTCTSRYRKCSSLIFPVWMSLHVVEIIADVDVEAWFDVVADAVEAVVALS